MRQSLTMKAGLLVATFSLPSSILSEILEYRPVAKLSTVSFIQCTSITVYEEAGNQLLHS